MDAMNLIRMLFRLPFMLVFFFRGVVIPYYIAQKSCLLAVSCAGLHVFYLVALLRKSFCCLQVAAWILMITAIWQSFAILGGNYGAFPLHEYYLQMITTLRINCENKCITPCLDVSLCCLNMECNVFQWIAYVDVPLTLYTAALFLAESATVLYTGVSSILVDKEEHILYLKSKSMSSFSAEFVEDDDTGFFEELYGGVGMWEESAKSDRHRITLC